jgi:hypothetical protein
MLRRLVFSAAMSTAVLAGAVPAASAAVAPGAAAAVPPVTHRSPLPLPLLEPQDSFTVTVSDPAASRTARRYKLTCEPAGGTHPTAKAACGRLAQLADDGRDPFAPVPEDAMCTMQYGGEATARITGIWQGENIDAAFNQKNGCEITRWRTLVPVLPGTR